MSNTDGYLQKRTQAIKSDDPIIVCSLVDHRDRKRDVQKAGAYKTDQIRNAACLACSVEKRKKYIQANYYPKSFRFVSFSRTMNIFKRRSAADCDSDGCAPEPSFFSAL